MKSKVILFCVLLFCSKIVDSIPNSEDLVRQRVNPLSNWQVNQNEPNGQYLDTQNVNIQQEKAQDYYSNQERYNYDNNGYNRSPVLSPSGEELLVSYDSPADGRSRVETYPSRTSQGGFDNQQYRTQNWRSQNQYANSVPSAIAVARPDDVTTVREPYRGPVQYVQPKYPKRRFYPPTAGRSYLTREQFQYLTGDKKYIANSAPRFGSSGSVPYDNYSEDQPTGGQRYAQSLASQSGIIYNEAPAVVATDTLPDQSEKIKYVGNFQSGSDLSNTAPITNYNDGSPDIAAADNYNSDSRQSNDPVSYESYREVPSEVKPIPTGGRRYQSFAPQSGNMKYSEIYKSAPITNHDDSSPLTSEADNHNSDSSNLARVNSKEEAPVVISKISSEKPPARSYANNYYRPDGWSNIARDDSDSAYGPKEPVPVNTNSGTSSAPFDTELVNSRSNKDEESNEARRGSSSPTTLSTNTKQNLYQKLNSGITEFNLKNLVANPDVQSILAGTSKRYLVVHSNGTVEPLDKIDLGSHQNSKLRLVHTNRSDGALKQQSPENSPNNIAKNPVPVDQPLPMNSQPTNDKKPTPLYVDQSKPADVYDSNLSPPLKDLPADHSSLKSFLQPEKQPADNKMYVIPPSDDDNSTPLTPNEDQSAHNDNLKPLPQYVNQPRDDDDSKPLTPHADESAVDGNSKPLPQDGKQLADDDNSKLLTSKEDQPADYDYSLPLSPNAGEPANIKKPENSYVKHPANDNNSKPVPTNENQPDYDRPFHTHRKQPPHHNRSKHLHVNKPADNSSPWYPNENHPADDNKMKPLFSNEKQPGDDNKSKPLPGHATQSANDTKFKPSNGDEAGYDNQSSKPSFPDENQPTDASKNDDQSNSKTESLSVSNYTTPSEPRVQTTHMRKHFHHKSVTNSPVVSTTPCPDNASEDQIITLSPIEQATDNVSDVPPEITTTTTTRPVENPRKSDTINDANSKQDDVQDDTAQTYSTTTLSPSSSASPTDNINDDKTIGTVENKNTQTNDKTVEDQVDNRKKDNRTAVYNSSELFDTNTDVPAESDDYSSVTASPSVQNDVNTGDASGDNSLKLEQSETGVVITVSSSTANDSGDEIITINIEISESTDDVDKSLVVNINTNDDSKDDSKKSKLEDCKKYHNSDDGRGKNVEIDMSNLKGEPTMWIKTTNQDFVDKLTAKNDTEFDVIYFFNIVNQPVIEREKTTTIHCNGTIVTETTELTYENKDDPAPTIVKSTKITQNETEV